MLMCLYIILIFVRFAIIFIFYSKFLLPYLPDYTNNEKIIEETWLMSPARYSHDDDRAHHFLKIEFTAR